MTRCAAVATWPEYATAVAVGPDEHDRIDVCASHGLDDLHRVGRRPADVLKAVLWSGPGRGRQVRW
ncbi:nucleotidyltransferase family protein [Micromonospora sp. NPDC048830]|uniref:nucleotidyltransferase family protein n=1 Tax=Micromonospora sp. NPDC048830 TaxID=3364257 RepID=UPI00371CFF43